MSLKLRCPACKNVFAAGNAPPGGIVNCPGCKAAIRVPTAAGSKPPQPVMPVAAPQPTGVPTDKKNDGGNDVGYWAITCVIGLLYVVFRKAGWISETTTRSQFMSELFKLGLIAAVVGLAVWGIIQLIRKALATPQVTPVSPPPPPPPPFAPPPRPTTPSGDQWWLQLHGQTTGPFTTAAVLEAVRLGDFSPTTPACPVGGNEWKPVNGWAAFTSSPSNSTQSAR